ncbi:MAG: transglycosylase SLT domain-containing protein [Campylobacteraceae bacterium]|nr:transglycosylase SLT domain-containing protein [Campylobacteraceae bacterium]
MKKILFLLIPFVLLATGFEDYKKQFEAEQNHYISQDKIDYKNYKKAFNSSYKEYVKEIKRLWPDKEVSTKKKWVQYNEDYKIKKVVDFEKNSIKIDVIAKDKNQAIKIIKTSLKDLLQENVTTAVKKDQLENKILKKLGKSNKIDSNEKIIADVLDKKIIIKYNKQIKSENISIKQYKKNKIYTIKFKLPNKTILNKAKIHTYNINKNAKKMKIPQELIYAIMESESSFNPMARSNIPAYGLMQIVPRSAGIDAYNFLYKEKKLLSSRYLYNPSNNIKMGTAYLHILYYRYLKHIKNPKSRLYCVIAAYNTGAGNVARAFISSTNIRRASKKINTMSPNEVYNTLLKKLPYVETIHYLSKVNKKIKIYNNLIKGNIL